MREIWRNGPVAVALEVNSITDPKSSFQGQH